MGRPSDYSDETAQEICARIMDGETLRQICLLEHMPDKSTVCRWLAAHEGFRDHYARAKEAQADMMAEELLDIADDGRNDWVERETRGGQSYVALNEEAVARSKLRVEARKWLMGKMKPKKYGDRQTIDHNVTVPLADALTKALARPTAPEGEG